MTRRALKAGLLAVAGAVACDDSTGPPGGRGTSFRFADEVGDTLLSAEEVFPNASSFDVSSVQGRVDGDSLILTVIFREPVAPLSSAATNSVYYEFEIDADENALTGAQSSLGEIIPDIQLGVEYVLLMIDRSFVRAGHRVALLDIEREDVEWVTVDFTANVVTVRIPLIALGDDEGSMRIAGAAGRPRLGQPTFQVVATDLMPNAGNYLVQWSGATPSAPTARLDLGAPRHLLVQPLPRYRRPSMERLFLAPEPR